MISARIFGLYTAVDMSVCNACRVLSDAELLRSLRREIGAPSRSTANNGSGGVNGGGASRRLVGGVGGINSLSSAGLLGGTNSSA